MKEIDYKTILEWKQSQKHFELLDVRTLFERQAFHIGGIHIPLDELHLRLSEIPKHIPLVVYCARGIRSVIAIEKLEAKGFQNLYQLKSGIKGFKEGVE